MVTFHAPYLLAPIPPLLFSVPRVSDPWEWIIQAPLPVGFQLSWPVGGTDGDRKERLAFLCSLLPQCLVSGKEYVHPWSQPPGQPIPGSSSFHWAPGTLSFPWGWWLLPTVASLWVPGCPLLVPLALSVPLCPSLSSVPLNQLHWLLFLLRSQLVQVGRDYI